MKRVWTQVLGPPTLVGGIVGSTAYDGESLYGPVTPAGYLWLLARDGSPRWVSPTADGAHYANAVAVVDGLENLESGRTYGFYCSLHPGMRGTLVAIWPPPPRPRPCRGPSLINGGFLRPRVVRTLH